MLCFRFLAYVAAAKHHILLPAGAIIRRAGKSGAKLTRAAGLAATSAARPRSAPPSKQDKARAIRQAPPFRRDRRPRGFPSCWRLPQAAGRQAASCLSTGHPPAGPDDTPSSQDISLYVIMIPVTRGGGEPVTLARCLPRVP